jgi:hypothetical protein
MARWAHDDRMERSLASRLDRSKERQRREMLHRVRDNLTEMSKRVAGKLIEAMLLETKSKRDIEDQINGCLEQLLEADEFEINYAISPYREVVNNPNLVALYLTSFVVERLINHESVVDVYGSDEQIYKAILSQVQPLLLRRSRESGYG